jgi:hypothetical protein
MGGLPRSETRSEVPGINLSSLSEAEHVQFTRDLNRFPCDCRQCPWNLLVCRRNSSHQCARSQNAVMQVLDDFLQVARR